MTRRLCLPVVVTLSALCAAPLATTASAMPRGDALAFNSQLKTNVETVQYRGAARWRGGGNYARGWRGRGWNGRGWRGRGGYGRGWYGPGWGWGAGLVGGAILGAAIAAPYYYGPAYNGRCWITNDPDRGYGYWAPC